MWHSGTLNKGHGDVVTGEWVASGSLSACACLKEREHVHMCIYRGGGCGNERDELMTICPCSCP